MAKLTDIVGIGPALSKLLSEHNIKTVSALASISMSKLLEVPGFSELRARAIIKAAKKCLQGGGVTTTSASKTSRSQTTPRKRATGKAITARRAVVQPEVVKEKEKKKKNKKSDKKKDKKKKNKGKGKSKK